MIVTVGDIVTDVVAVLRAEFAPGSDAAAAIRISGGGQAANTAAWLAWHGSEATFVGAVGDDQPGRDRLAELRAEGVRVQVGVRPGVATGSVVVLSHGPERTMVSDRGANVLLDPADVAAALRAGARRLHLSGYTLLGDASRPAGLRALELARAARVPFSVDAASAAPLARVAAEFLVWARGADVVFANVEEALTLVGAGEPEEQAMRLARATGGWAVVKRGSDGAVWADGDSVRSEAGMLAPVVDASGAGDAFAAGFLAAREGGDGVDVALEAGCRLGAQAVGVVGARPPLS